MHKVIMMVILLCAMLTAGCQQQQQETPRELNICSSMEGKATKLLVQDFAGRSGIKINIVQLPAGSFNERLEFIKKNNIDCWLGGTVEEYYLASQQHLLQPYQAAEAYKVPAAMRSKEGYWTSLYLEYIAFLSNKDKLHQLGLYAPNTWNELLRPQLHGEIVIPDFVYGGASYGMLTSIWQLRGKKGSAAVCRCIKQAANYLCRSSDGSGRFGLQRAKDGSCYAFALCVKAGRTLQSSVCYCCGGCQP